MTVIDELTRITGEIPRIHGRHHRPTSEPRPARDAAAARPTPHQRPAWWRRALALIARAWAAIPRLPHRCVPGVLLAAGLGEAAAAASWTVAYGWSTSTVVGASSAGLTLMIRWGVAWKR